METTPDPFDEESMATKPRILSRLLKPTSMGANTITSIATRESESCACNSTGVEDDIILMRYLHDIFDRINQSQQMMQKEIYWIIFGEILIIAILWFIFSTPK